MNHCLSAKPYDSAVLCQFETLLKSDPKESQLEDFLAAHYQDVFGRKYDRIETQLWLRFPGVDIANKNRRLDVFLRNSVSNDWDLFEIKRLIPLSRTYRDVPVLASEVLNAIQQAKNYSRVLQQDSVKRHFAQQGIEYYEPCLNVVVGRTPEIPHEQWRWLQSISDMSVNIIAFDELIAELRLRLADKYAMLERMAV